MKQFIAPLLACCLFISGTAGGATAQNLIRVNLNNRSHGSVYIIAYDPICRIRVFEGVLVNNGTMTVRVCANNRGLGSIVIYDVHGRSLEYSPIRDGSRANIRFR